MVSGAEDLITALNDSLLDWGARSRFSGYGQDDCPVDRDWLRPVAIKNKDPVSALPLGASLGAISPLSRKEVKHGYDQCEEKAKGAG